MTIDTSQPIHDFFSLSYASYLVLPRSILQSAPKLWQNKFVKLLEELEDMFDYVQDPGDYQVYLRSDRTGRYVSDPLCDYERGRRRIPIKKDLICPVCGYYCLGKGGMGCINKPNLLGLDKNKSNTGK